MKTIGLCMIVKNEARVISRCLDSVRSLVDYVLIEDTGSTDGTQEIIREYLKKENIRGEVYSKPWRDFAANRSHVLGKLRERKEIDYALMMDADDILVFDNKINIVELKNSLSAQCYNVWISLNTIRYYRPQIFSNRLDFRYRGVLHEFAEAPGGGAAVGPIDGLHIRAGVEGDRSKNSDKYRRDAAILEKALKHEKDQFLRSRYTFYLANSYRDCGEKEKALENYLKRAKLGHWIEEIFISLYNAGHLRSALGHSSEEVLAVYRRACNAVPKRAEAYHAAARYCRDKQQYQEAYTLAKRGLAVPEPADGLFVEPWVYDYGLLDEFAVSAYWTGNYRESFDACERLLREGKLPEGERSRIEANLDFARRQLSASNHPAASPTSEVAVVCVRSPGDVHAGAYAELAETLVYGFRRLGRDTQLVETPPEATGPIVVLTGAHCLAEEDAERVPANAIIYNTEHSSSEHLKTPWYLKLLKKHDVWDYSDDNAARLSQSLGKPIRYVPIGFVPELARIARNDDEDIDVLFYGSTNARRTVILDRLRGEGLNVHHAFGVYGAERDLLIARAKIVLNMHFYLPGAMEAIRLSYLLANRTAVVTEHNPGEQLDEDLADGLVAVPYDGLVDACKALVGDPARRRAVAERGFAAFSKRDEGAILKDVFDPSPPVVPRRLNLGSGKDWRPLFLNVDQNDNWSPDIVADISSTTLFDDEHDSARFGSFVLPRNHFDEIIAIDLLEHIGDLGQAMTNCLSLLREGGVMRIQVPYDLSYGAWQDPTHVRAFNERSWWYYCQWYWYLGWTEARFDLIELVYDFSELGAKLKSEGRSEDEIARVPRAVDDMRVVLRKRPLTADEITEGARRRDRS